MSLGRTLRNTIAHELRAIRGSIHKRLAGPRAIDGSLVDAFHKQYFDARAYNLTWRNTYWLGHSILKCPLDLWLYQEIIHKLRPAVVVETGTAFGGSALFLASMFDLVGHGRVITVDIQERPGRPEHSRVTYLTGSSVSPEMLARVRELVGQDGPVLVLLDSDHSAEHVGRELEAYHSLVSVGSYLVVEDTNLNGHPVEPEHGPGPWEATQVFLASHPEFAHDAEMDKFLLSFNPRGYLRRLR